MSNVDEILNQYGIIPKESDLNEVRNLLIAETKKENESQGQGDTELMKLLCFYLFQHNQTKDTLLIWSAKVASMDADCSIDIQLLCGGGLESTKQYLENLGSHEATLALRRIRKCANEGDFEGFDPLGYRRLYEEYYADE
jgi:hypothetical protein